MDRLPAHTCSITAAFVLAAVLTACGNATPDATPLTTPEAIPSPAAAGSGQPNLHAVGSRVYLSWLEPQDDTAYALRFARLEEDGWSDPRTITQGEDYFVNWADFPSVVELPDGTLAAHWLVRSSPETYAYDVHVSRSKDGGRSWSESVVPHRDGTPTEHGFVSLFPGPSDRLSVVWLDGRNYAGTEHGAMGAEMTLRYAALDAEGTIGSEALLDPRTCDCCQTAAALTSAGPVIVYRDRSAEEIRDISVVRLVNGEWTDPAPVHADGWEIAACPVNGPAVSAEGEKVVVAWFTAAGDTPRVRVAFSDDAGASFAEPIRIDTGDPTGRVAVELLPTGSALVSWLERVGEGAEVRVRRVGPDGSRSAPQTIVASSAARASGFPRMARSGNEVVFAWTEPGDPTRVRIATARLGSE